MKNTFWHLVGYCTFSCTKDRTVALLNLLASHAIPVIGTKCHGETFSVSVPPWYRKAVRSALAQGAFPVQMALQGSLGLLWDCRARVGLLIGALVALCMVIVSSHFVWDIRISGNERVPDEVILASLDSAGLSIGQYIQHSEWRQIAVRLQQNTPGLAWVGLYCQGNVAYVEVLEDVGPEGIGEEERSCTNLIAREDAVIDSLSVLRGETAVRAGQTVCAGQLLVSGVTEGQEGGELIHAEGQVYGRVERTFTVTVPRQIACEVVQEEKNVHYRVNLWGKDRIIYDKTGNLPTECAIIYEKEQWYLLGQIRLPFYTVRGYTVVRTETEEKQGEKEMVFLATRLMQQELAVGLQDAELLSKCTEGYFTDTAYIMTCHVTCIVDIAQEQRVDTVWWRGE